MVALALFVAACGGSDDSSATGGGGATHDRGGKVAAGKKGGTLTVLAAGDVDYIDPGETYYQFGYMVQYAGEPPAVLVQARTDTVKPVPDLAEGEPADLRRTTRPSRSRSRRASSTRRRSTARSRPRTSSTRSSARSPSRSANGYAGCLLQLDRGRAGAGQDGRRQADHGHRDARRHTIVFKLKHRERRARRRGRW